MATTAATLLPPGPKGRPIVGIMPDFRRDPLGLLTALARDYGAVVRVTFMNRATYIVSDPELIEQVLVTNSRSYIKSRALRRSRDVFGQGLLTSEGDFWKQQRRLVQPAFNHSRLIGYGATMVAYSGRMMDGWSDGATRDIHEDMMRLTMEIVGKTLFDADVTSAADEIGSAIRVLINFFFSQRRLLMSFLPEKWRCMVPREQDEALAQIERVIYRIISARRAENRDHGDLLSMLLAARDEGGNPMSDKQLRDECLTLFLAGHETTALALSWSWYLLAQNPAAEKALHAELDTVLADHTPTLADLPRLPYVEQTIKEALRLYPPAWTVAREPIEPVEIGGYRIAAGAQVIVSQWVMQRDPRFYIAPLAFDPGRWTEEMERRLPKYAYFPFGGGQRLCIGKNFALMEAQLILATIAQRYRFSLAPDQNIAPQASITLRPKNGIKMRLERRDEGPVPFRLNPDT